MKKIKLLFIGLIILNTFSCSVIKNQNKGNVIPENFNYKTDFTTVKSVIILPVEINGAIKNFLFDTGADLTFIQRDKVLGKIEKISGVSNRKMKTGNELVKSFKIGSVDFTNTIAWNGNLISLKEQIPNFGGLIGQPIISKANWLIDYTNKKIQFSNKNLIDSTFHPVKIKRKDGAPYVKLMIDGKEYKVIIDLGSSSAFSIPKNSKLAKAILNKYNFQDNEREIYSVGGLQKVKEKIGVITLIKIGGIDFPNVETNIRQTSQLRIGNKFFKDYKVYIDNIKNNYSLKRSN
jgi:hypothetical protein